MNTLRNLGLLGLLGLASACSGWKDLPQGNDGVIAVNLCKIENNQLYIDRGISIETSAVDTDGDGNYDEAFVTKGYTNVGLSNIKFESDIAKVTTHYVVPGVEPQKQMLTGFSDTKPMTPEYQRALKLICNGQ